MDDRLKRRALLGVMLSVFLAAMESTVVATAMPIIVKSLGGLAIYAWVFAGFILTSTVTMPLWGRLSDLFGRRSTFLTGLAIFLVGSALSGVSRDMTQLIVFRMLQGLGAGSLMTIGMTIVADLFGLERRAKMQGYISGVWGLASLVGPLLGGFLTDQISWRWVFYINVPFGLVAIALLAGALRGMPPSQRRPVIDYGGLAFFTVGISALLYGVSVGGMQRFSTPGALVPIAAAVISLVAFVQVERRAQEPIVPLRLFRNRMVRAAVTTGFLSGMAMFGTLSFVPLFLQGVANASATRAGLVLTPFVLGWVTMSIVSARLVLKIGYRPVVTAGMLSLTISFLLLTRWDAGLTTLVAIRDALLGGMGMGLSMVPMLIGVQSAVSRADLGVATSLTQFFRSVGGAVGVAVMGAVKTQRLDAGVPLEGALHSVFVVGLIICLAALASAFLVPAGRARDLARPELRSEPTRVGG
ncbi:MAG: MFS transporter [Candidatus Rokubacteria bacterium]|nr:MFS transporter [Candidatus Rokubacteria bacterium]